VVEALLAERSTGQVYRARHERLNVPVAVTIHPQAATGQDRARLERAAYLMARIRNDHVVALLDYWISETGEPVLITELVKGQSLKQLLAEAGALPWSRVADIGLGIMKGLNAVHGADVIHRNLQPDTIYIEPGPPEFVKLADMGLATSTRGDTKNITSFGKVVGNMKYQAPELAFGDPASTSSDLYAAGLVMYELLTGTVPSAAERRMTPPPLPDGLPDRFNDLLNALLAPIPSRGRCESATVARQELERIQTRALKKAVRERLAEIDFDALDKLRIDPGTVVGPRSQGNDSIPLCGLVAVGASAERVDVRRWLAAQLKDSELGFGIRNGNWVAALAASSDVGGRARLDEFAALARTQRVPVALLQVDSSFDLSSATLQGRFAPPLEVIRLLDAPKLRG